MGKNTRDAIIVISTIGYFWGVSIGVLKMPDRGGVDHIDVVLSPETEKIEQTAFECVRDVYTGFIGVRESGGNNRGLQVGKFLKYTGLTEGYAWCTAFTCYCLGQCGVQNPKTAWTPALGSHRSGETIYLKHRDKFPLEVGDNNMVFTLYYKNLGREGHSGFIDQIKDKQCVTVEGNTNDGGGNDGDGVHRMIRPKSVFYKIRVFNKLEKRDTNEISVYQRTNRPHDKQHFEIGDRGVHRPVVFHNAGSYLQAG